MLESGSLTFGGNSVSPVILLSPPKSVNSSIASAARLPVLPLWHKSDYIEMEN